MSAVITLYPIDPLHFHNQKIYIIIIQNDQTPYIIRVYIILSKHIDFTLKILKIGIL